MGVITGRLAKISDLVCSERFQIVTNEAFDNAAACSDSGGAILRGASNYDWKGWAACYGYTPPKMPGDLFTLTAGDGAGQGWVSADNGAIVDKVKIFCNENDAKLFYYHIWFSANGILTPGAAVPVAGSVPTQVSSKGMAIDRDGAVTGVGYWDLEIEGNNSEPIWTPEGSGWPYRGPGNIDATITWRQHFDTASTLPAIGASSIYKLYVTDTLYWEVKWGQTSDIPAMYVIRNQNNRPEYVVAECKARFSGYADGVQGYIKKPAVVPADPVAYWPAA